MVVTAHADRAKAGMLANLSLALAEQWWVRELQPVGPAAAPGRFSGPGFSGTLGPAPGVYDPGGPVFQNDRVGESTDLDAIERAAAAQGAVLAVLPAAPDTAREHELRLKGWHVASDWYLGIPEGRARGLPNSWARRRAASASLRSRESASAVRAGGMTGELPRWACPPGRLGRRSGDGARGQFQEQVQARGLAGEQVRRGEHRGVRGGPGSALVGSRVLKSLGDPVDLVGEPGDAEGDRVGGQDRVEAAVLSHPSRTRSRR